MNIRTKNMVSVSFVFLLLLIVICFIAACQPTPEEKAVAQKGND